MNKFLYLVLSLMLCAVFSFSVQDTIGVIEGTVKKVDATTGTIVVETVDGANHAFHFVNRTAVHGIKKTAKGSKETLHGLREGSEAAVYYTSKGTATTAEEIDYIGKDGLEIGEGTIKNIDRDAKTLTLKSANGNEEIYRLSERAARDAGRDLGRGIEKSEKVTVYYTEEVGHKVAHFFKKVI